MFSAKSRSAHPWNLGGLLGAGTCRPAVVDWNRDGFLDVLVGTMHGITYYERQKDGKLQAHPESQAPFQGIGVGAGCNNLAVEDLDGDGDLDLMVGNLYKRLSYFEQTSDGRLEAKSNPLGDLPSDRAMLADWDGDGRTDILVLMDLNQRRTVQLLSLVTGLSCCPVSVYLQKQAGVFTQVDSLRGPVEVCNCFL